MLAYSQPDRIFETQPEIDFLLEVRDCAPNVLQYLKREVFPFADTQKFEACLSEWASVHNLPADWVIDIGRKTVKKWKRQPSTLERNKLDWAVLGLPSAIRAELSNEQTMIHLPTLSWNPQYPPPTLKKVSESQLKRQPDLQFMKQAEFKRQSLSAINQAFRQEIDRIDTLIAEACKRKENPLKRAPRLRSREGFEWAVQIQVLKEEVVEIAAREKTESLNVIKRAREVLDLIEVTPRAGCFDIYK